MAWSMTRIGMAALAAGMVACAGGGAAWAQQPGVEKGSAARAGQGGVYTISVDFRGGPVSAYVEMLKAACKPRPVNVVLAGSAGKQVMSAVSLEGASLAAAMQAIPAASVSGPDAWRVKRLADVLAGEEAGDTRDVAPVYQVMFVEARNDPFRAPWVMEVFSMRGVVEGAAAGQAADDRIASALTAVETALQMDAQRTAAPEMKFHKESGLLIVRGAPEDVAAVKEVIGRMSDDAGRASDEAARRESARKINEINVMRAQVNLKAAHDRMEMATARMKELEQMYAAGTAPTGEVRQAKVELSEREADVQRAELEVQAAQAAVQGGGAWRGAKESRLGSGEGKGDVEQLRHENEALKDKLEAMSKRVKDLEAALASATANNRK